MKRWVRYVLLGNLLLFLLFFIFSIVKKEEILSEGKLVLLKLAPVDPRSLMQGDYMTLRYDITNNSFDTDIPRRGVCIVRLDEDGVASFVRYQKKPEGLTEDELPIEYTRQDWRVTIGAESFFFQEGMGDKYDRAKYGGLRIDQKGNSVLVGLYDEKLKLIE